MLPPIARGEVKSCFGVTEPNTGLNTTQLKLRAVRNGDRYVVNGQKVWISTAQVADRILLLARTTPLEEVTKPRWASAFSTPTSMPRIPVREIEKMGRASIERALLRRLRDPGRRPDRRGRARFEYILHGMNPERV